MKSIYQNVRFKKTTMQKLKILKAKRNDKDYDTTLLYLLKKKK